MKEDWEDFHLAGTFVFAFGSEQLYSSALASSVLWARRTPGALGAQDRTLLFELVRELGAFLFPRKSATGGRIR